MVDKEAAEAVEAMLLQLTGASIQNELELIKMIK